MSSFTTSTVYTCSTHSLALSFPGSPRTLFLLFLFTLFLSPVSLLLIPPSSSPSPLRIFFFPPSSSLFLPPPLISSCTQTIFLIPDLTTLLPLLPSFSLNHTELRLQLPPIHSCSSSSILIIPNHLPSSSFLLISHHHPYSSYSTPHRPSSSYLFTLPHPSSSCLLTSLLIIPTHRPYYAKSSLFLLIFPAHHSSS